MKSSLILVLMIVFQQSINAQFYTGPVPKPISGYGSDGLYEVDTHSYANPNFITEDIVLYFPKGISSPVPTIFYSHGFGGNNPANVAGLLNFVAKKGYAIVFVPYQTNNVTSLQRYSNLLSGFIKTARRFPNIIDTTKVGFMGHSFGGGATFANAYHCFTKLNWGQNARFLFASAQWFCLNITQTEMQSFPSNVKLLTMVYEHDSTNDHRMANEVFRNINIPASEKDYLQVRQDTINNYVYDAIHGVPNTASAFDAFDYYAIYRHLDALCDYSFNGNASAKDVALGNGSPAQINMPAGMKPLIHSDQPTYCLPSNLYNYPCDVIANPRRIYCNQLVSVQAIQQDENRKVYLNSEQQLLIVNTSSLILSVNVYDVSGNLLETSINSEISISKYPKGLFFVEVITSDGIFCQKLVNL